MFMGFGEVRRLHRLVYLGLFMGVVVATARIYLDKIKVVVASAPKYAGRDVVMITVPGS